MPLPPPLVVFQLTVICVKRNACLVSNVCCTCFLRIFFDLNKGNFSIFEFYDAPRLMTRCVLLLTTFRL